MPLERALRQEAATKEAAKERERETEEAKGKQITLIAYKRTPKNNPQRRCAPYAMLLFASSFRKHIHLPSSPFAELSLPTPSKGGSI